MNRILGGVLGAVCVSAAASAAPANFKLAAFEYQGKKVTDLNAVVEAHPGETITFFLKGDPGDRFQLQKNVVSEDGKTTKQVGVLQEYKIGPAGEAKVVWTINKEGKPGGRIAVFATPKLNADGTADKLASWIFGVAK